MARMDGSEAAVAVATAADKENMHRQAEALREQVFRRILSSDVLSSMKAHLRARIYAELKCCSSNSGSNDRVAMGLQPLQAQPRSPTLHQHVLNCLLGEYLLSQQYRYTLSVFLAESGRDTLPQLCHTDILRLAGVLPESKVHAMLISVCSRGGTSDTNSTSGDALAGSVSGSGRPHASLAEAMVAVLGRLGGHISTSSAGSQTSGNGDGWDSSGGRSAAITSQQLVQRLQQIEQEYQQKRGNMEQAAAQSLEERMAAYQQECDARYSKQLQEQLAAMRDAEVGAAREQEAAQCRQQLEAERAALHQAHQERLAQLNKQEEELLERRRRAAAEQDLAAEEHLRRIRADEEQQAAWRAQSEAKLMTARVAAQQAQQQAEAAEQRAETQRLEGEQRLQARLAEVQAREAEALKAQAAAEVDLARVAGLQRQLAAALEEQGGLRQQLATAKSMHQAEQAELRLEAEGLRRDKERLEAAAAASGAAPGLPPGDAARLHLAVQRLMQRVEQLQDEVAACRQRERVWRASAAAADKLVDKGGKAQDRALQHGEELRLALAAAAREVADLQQQASLAATGAEGPLAAALQAASRDAQRWREGAEARVEAAKREEEGLQMEAAQLRQRALANRTAVAQGLQQVLAAHVQGSRQEQEEEGLEFGDSGSPDDRPPSVQHAAEAAGGATTAAEPFTGVVPAVRRAAAASDFHQLAAQVSKERTGRGSDPQLPNPILPWMAQQEAYQHMPLGTQPPSGVAASNGLDGAQQDQDSDANSAPKWHNRTASDILAAYRARQQRAATGGGGNPGGVPGTNMSREASVSEPEAAGQGSPEAKVGVGVPAGEQPGATGKPTTAGNAGGGISMDADGYYVSDFTSDDSNRF